MSLLAAVAEAIRDEGYYPSISDGSIVISRPRPNPIDSYQIVVEVEGEYVLVSDRGATGVKHVRLRVPLADPDSLDQVLGMIDQL